PIESKLKDGRADSTAADGRDRNESPPPLVFGDIEAPNPPAAGTMTFPPMPDGSTMFKPPPRDEPEPRAMAPNPPRTSPKPRSWPTARVLPKVRTHPHKTAHASTPRPATLMSPPHLVGDLLSRARQRRAIAGPTNTHWLSVMIQHECLDEVTFTLGRLSVT